MFLQGELALGSFSARAVPLSAVRSDKPQAYVQILNQNRVQHLGVQAGTSGRLGDQAMVVVGELPEDSWVIEGSVGTLREGTLVKVKTTSGTP
jgi:hypothetical protein